MLLLISIVHLIVAVLLICFVLLQDSKGGGVFGMGSSGGGQVFSATGAANFFVKTTRVLAIVFAITCITLTYLTTKPSSSVVDGFVPPATPVENPAADPAAANPAKPAAANPAPESNKEKK